MEFIHTQKLRVSTVYQRFDAQFLRCVFGAMSEKKVDDFSIVYTTGKCCQHHNNFTVSVCVCVYCVNNERKM